MKKNRKMVVMADNVKCEFYLIKTSIKEIIHLSKQVEKFEVIEYKE